MYGTPQLTEMWYRSWFKIVLFRKITLRIALFCVKFQRRTLYTFVLLSISMLIFGCRRYYNTPRQCRRIENRALTMTYWKKNPLYFTCTKIRKTCTMKLKSASSKIHEWHIKLPFWYSFHLQAFWDNRYQLQYLPNSAYTQKRLNSF